MKANASLSVESFPTRIGIAIVQREYVVRWDPLEQSGAGRLGGGQFIVSINMPAALYSANSREKLLMMKRKATL
jgi:hypothetical protein